MKITLAERAQKILRDKDINQVELGRLAGCTKGAVNQWLKSKPKAMMAPVYAYTLADKTDYEPRWLMLGEGPELRNPYVDNTHKITLAYSEPPAPYITGFDKETMALASYYQQLPAEVRAKFLAAVVTSLTQICLSDPAVDFDKIGDLIKIMRNN